MNYKTNRIDRNIPWDARSGCPRRWTSLCSFQHPKSLSSLKDLVSRNLANLILLIYSIVNVYNDVNWQKKGAAKFEVNYEVMKFCMSA